MSDPPTLPQANPRRRTVMARCLGAFGLSMPVILMAERSAWAQDIAQPSGATPAAFMARAREMKALALDTGDQGYGAVVVKGRRIVGQAPSRVVVGGDPTAHAETEAIRDAARRLGTRSLAGCTLYSTSRPCPMCEAAAYWANLETMIYGSAMTDAGTPRLHRC